MINPLVLPADVVSYLVPYLRASLVAQFPDVKVADAEPDANTKWPAELVVIRHDLNSATSVITEDVSIAASVYAGTVENPRRAREIGRYVYAYLRAAPGLQVGNPIAAVLESNGPYLTSDERSVAVSYQTHSFSAVGTPI